MNRLLLSLLLLTTLFSVTCKRPGKGAGGAGALPLSTFFNNRMLLLLKGSYATDNPLEFSSYQNGSGNLYQDSDAGADLTAVPKAADLGIYIDVGEIRISSKLAQGYGNLIGIQNVKDSKNFWDFITSERQVYCTSLYTLDNNQCKRDGGYVTIQDLFNGNGVKYPSNDPTAETKSPDGINYVPTIYYYTGIYFRSFVTTWARGNNAQLTTRFDNFQVNGENIVPRNNYQPGTDATLKSSTVPAMFPLLYSVKAGQLDMGIRGGVDPYILEVRMNIKENLMVHSYVDAANVTRTIVGFSDWNIPHNGEPDMAGNLLARSRVIYPETASKVVITGGTASVNHYYGIYRDGETEILKELPLAASPVKQGSSTIQYIQEGGYNLYCLGDTLQPDGFPDTIVRSTPFSVSSYPFKQTITVDLACP